MGKLPGTANKIKDSTRGRKKKGREGENK